MPHVATPLAPLAPPAHHGHSTQSLLNVPRAGLCLAWSVRQVIIFYSMLPSGEMDDFSLHGGCDVLDEQATKWSANFWLWNKPYHFIDAARQRGTQDLMDSWL